MPVKKIHTARSNNDKCLMYICILKDVIKDLKEQVKSFIWLDDGIENIKMLLRSALPAIGTAFLFQHGGFRTTLSLIDDITVLNAQH
jgi:hypothetical protein